MFGITDLRRRVSALEKKIAAAEIKTACIAGEHEWELCTHGGQSDAHARCKHCYFHPTDPKGGKS